MKGLLEEFGLNVTGRKGDLVDRLQGAYDTAAALVASNAADAHSGVLSVGAEDMEISEGASARGGAAAATSGDKESHEKDGDSSDFQAVPVLPTHSSCSCPWGNTSNARIVFGI
jgi:hypothetical protein